MKCPFCGKADSQVLESRTVSEGDSVRRRRECLACGKRFTTQEKVKNHFLWVVKKDGGREPFEKEKIKRGILRAIEKRPISLDLVNEIADEVEREILKKEKEEIPSRAIGNAVMRRLKKIDKVAWLRFASVYLEFEDLSDFEHAIEKNEN
jgi:transcriptional repressor NrdR